MTEVKDCYNHLVCKVEESSGFVEASYKKQTTSTYLPVGESFKIDRAGVVTIITRDTDQSMKVTRNTP